jgi:hypothetical protein
MGMRHFLYLSEFHLPIVRIIGYSCRQLIKSLIISLHNILYNQNSKVYHIINILVILSFEGHFRVNRSRSAWQCVIPIIMYIGFRPWFTVLNINCCMIHHMESIKATGRKSLMDSIGAISLYLSDSGSITTSLINCT